MQLNYGVIKGYTRFVDTMDKLLDEMRTGFLTDESMENMLYSQGHGTTHNLSLSSSTWHFSFLLLVWFVATIVPKLLVKILPLGISVPETSVAMILSLLLMMLVNKLRLTKFLFLII